jgi:hypothetical protein
MGTKTTIQFFFKKYELKILLIFLISIFLLCVLGKKYQEDKRQRIGYK